MRYQVAQYSLRGGRKSNQDRVAYLERENSVLMIVADGLGGHKGGALAAETLVQVATRAFQNIKHPVISRPSAFLALTIMQAHRAIQVRGLAHIPPITPRTTCVMCLVQNGYAYWAHVGDSRLYHFRNKQVLKRTLDHTTIEQFHTDGLLSEEEMHTHPEKSHLLKCLGGGGKPSISLGAETLLERNDVLLLCSDGLWEAFTPDELIAYLQAKSLEETVEIMLHDAEDKMGSSCDNLSAACLRWEDHIPASMPLQSNNDVQADQQILWQQAQLHTAEKVLQEKVAKGHAESTKPVAAKAKKKSLDSAIEELESFVKRYEPK